MEGLNKVADELLPWADQQGGEYLFPTTKGWAVAHWNNVEEVASNGVAMVGIPVTLGDGGTTIWLGADEGKEVFADELDYWLSVIGADRIDEGLSSSSE